MVVCTGMVVRVVVDFPRIRTVTACRVSVIATPVGIPDWTATKSRRRSLSLLTTFHSNTGRPSAPAAVNVGSGTRDPAPIDDPVHAMPAAIATVSTRSVFRMVTAPHAVDVYP
jgi:hypothetical protein